MTHINIHTHTHLEDLIAGPIILQGVQNVHVYFLFFFFGNISLNVVFVSA